MRYQPHHRSHSLFSQPWKIHPDRRGGDGASQQLLPSFQPFKAGKVNRHFSVDLPQYMQEKGFRIEIECIFALGNRCHGEIQACLSCYKQFPKGESQIVQLRTKDNRIFYILILFILLTHWIVSGNTLKSKWASASVALLLAHNEIVTPRRSTAQCLACSAYDPSQRIKEIECIFPPKNIQERKTFAINSRPFC